jgi:hypothetical protein
MGQAMTKVILDATLRGKLLDLNQPLELLDESGRLLGRFIPTSTLGECNEPQLDETELARRETEPDFSTAEVLAYLEKL